MQKETTPNVFTAKDAKLPSFPDFWGRPPVEGYDELNFCVIDIVYRTTPVPNSTYDHRTNGEVAVVDLHGIDQEGHSVTLHAHDYEPYFYCSIPSDFQAGSINLFKSNLNNALSGVSKNPDVPVVRKVEIVDKRNIMYYHPDETQRFLKVTTQLPKQVASCRRVIEEGKVSMPNAPNFAIQTFESNVDFVLRFMNDREITGCSWVTVPKDKYTVRGLKDKKTHSQIEADTNYASIIHHDTEDEWMAIPKFRIISFDIEVGGEPDHFPTPENDPVIQICAYVQVQGDPEPLFSVAFVLDTCSKLVGTALYQFEEEKSLLMAWQKFIRFIDPDIVTGYNIANFDWPYLVQRAKKIGCNEFCQLGRYIGEYSEAKDVTKNIKVLGRREGKEVDIPGVINYDMFVSIQTDYKLRSYTLNAVSAHFLHDQKEDVHYSMISKLQKGTPHDRHRLAIYCVKDAYLPLRLMNNLLSVFTSVELARVCHVPFNYLLNRGQQIRVFSQLLNKANKRNMIIPAVRSQKSDDQYQGATVIEPKAGYYTTPIPTLDFASLYPSIMIAHNLCYSTLVRPGDKVSCEFETSPNNKRFVTSEQFHGVLPEILKELLAARKRTRALQAQEKDPLKKSVLNCRQLALKVSANSVYGFTGATVGKLPCLDISETVTAYGRTMIDQTKNIVEEKYTIANGYKNDAVVVYGDTDSVMVNFGNITLSEAIELGKEAADYVSQSFPPPIHLEFEKAYQPYLLISKKHYAGLLHTSATEAGRIDAKGIETVRRDNCRLVQNLLQKALDLLLIQQDKDKAIQFVKKVISDLLQDKIDLSFLVISKALTKNDYKAKQPHVELAHKMAKRDPGSAPRLGDRIAYVITAVGKSSKAYEKSEDPIYVLENGLQIDTKYYLENQLQGPLTRLFTPIMGESHVNNLLQGQHTLHVKKAPLRKTEKPKAGSLMSFVQVRETCICGKSPIDKGKKPVCSNCKDSIIDVYENKMKEFKFIEEEHSKLWAQCQRCQKSLMTQNICTACDCPIFYKRKKAQLDLEDMYKAIKKFDGLLKFQ
ncbi:polymerase zeta subunit [Tritrichomonas foetus]|uniref:DNA polymerase n=1 Tax=Tritrichomonas foetus TaxID=1144522 RepID=A0A1J4JU39_9EUKA|nr:polymerase zeta subunit [Tritrichomonas foetus]|eukprot:OHT02663.1 polymerase zeta subunit [Tritrichomonas foetus]